MKRESSFLIRDKNYSENLNAGEITIDNLCADNLWNNIFCEKQKDGMDLVSEFSFLLLLREYR